MMAAKKRQGRDDNQFFLSSDDNAMMKQIQASHAPDGREFDVKPLLQITGDILCRAPPATPGLVTGTQLAQLDALDDQALQAGFTDMLEVLAHTISKISCEISCKRSGGGDAHQTTVTLFNMLSNYSWDAKVVLSLAAFAVNYGEFWLVTQLYPTNTLAKSIALVKQLPEIVEHADTLKPKFDALNNLVKAMLDVTRCIVEFKELPSQHITPDTPQIVAATAHIPTAVYWTIRSIVASASQMMGLTGMGHEFTTSTMEAWELSSLAHKVSNIHSHLKKQLDLCYRYIDERIDMEAYQTLVHLFETLHIDNMKILKVLIGAKDDQMPLYEGTSKQKFNVDKLRRKNVLLLISDKDISQDEVAALKKLYSEYRNQPRREDNYEVVWLPVVDESLPWTTEKQREFETVRDLMPWYSVDRPSVLDRAVVKYIREEWHFNKKTILVALDPQGRVVNPNALHMMWIWRSQAFPFTIAREEALWKDATWSIEFLVDNIHPDITNWISEGKFICLYGGEDMVWIRRFTKSLRAVANTAYIPLEMLYVGRTNPRENVRKNNTAIVEENLSSTLPDLNAMWFFWVRLESMWHSKMQHGGTVGNDPIRQEIMAMLSFDGSEQGWVVIGQGSAAGQLAKASGDTIVASLDKFDEWKAVADEKGFLPAMLSSLGELQPPHHCTRLILPGVDPSDPAAVACAECGRPMEKFVMYRCCND